MSLKNKFITTISTCFLMGEGPFVNGQQKFELGIKYAKQSILLGHHDGFTHFKDLIHERSLSLASLHLLPGKLPA